MIEHVVQYYEIPLAFFFSCSDEKTRILGLEKYREENVSNDFMRLFESARSYYTTSNKIQMELTFRNKAIYARYWSAIVTTENINIEQIYFLLIDRNYILAKNYEGNTELSMIIRTIYFSIYHATNDHLNSLFSNVDRLKIVHDRIWQIPRQITQLDSNILLAQIILP